MVLEELNQQFEKVIRELGHEKNITIKITKKLQRYPSAIFLTDYWFEIVKISDLKEKGK